MPRKWSSLPSQSGRPLRWAQPSEGSPSGAAGSARSCAAVETLCTVLTAGMVRAACAAEHLQCGQGP